MVSGMEEETFDSKIDLCRVCGPRVMSYSVLCAVCGKWVHARCTDNKNVIVYLAKDFACKKCGGMINILKGQDEILCQCVETVTEFFFI